MRLTSKEPLPRVPCYVEIQKEDYKTKHRQQAINKLGQLEDIEDELGIEITTLFKALKNGIYAKHRNNIEYRMICDLGFNEDNGFILSLDKYNHWGVFTYTYGKDWALSEEELK